MVAVGCDGDGATVVGVGRTGVAVTLGGAVMSVASDGLTSSGESPEEQAAAINATSSPPQTALARSEKRMLDWRVAF